MSGLNIAYFVFALIGLLLVLFRDDFISWRNKVFKPALFTDVDGLDTGTYVGSDDMHIVAGIINWVYYALTIVYIVFSLLIDLKLVYFEGLVLITCILWVVFKLREAISADRKTVAKYKRLQILFGRIASFAVFTYFLYIALFT